MTINTKTSSVVINYVGGMTCEPIGKRPIIVITS